VATFSVLPYLTDGNLVLYWCGYLHAAVALSPGIIFLWTSLFHKGDVACFLRGWNQSCKYSLNQLHLIQRSFAQTVTHLVCIRKVPGSNLGQDTEILNKVYRDFSQSFQSNIGQYQSWDTDSILKQMINKLTKKKIRAQNDFSCLFGKIMIYFNKFHSYMLSISRAFNDKIKRVISVLFQYCQS
jgi:hypothetical protein